MATARGWRDLPSPSPLPLTTVYAPPGTPGSPVSLRERYGNFVGGAFGEPADGMYRLNDTPVTGEPFCEVAASTPADVEHALDAAHAAQPAWGARPPAARAAVLEAMADAMDDQLEMLAVSESYDNGKPVCESVAVDLPAAIDHVRRLAGLIRGDEGTVAQRDGRTHAHHLCEPLGVVGLIIPSSFPLLMAVREIALALAAGNAVVLKPASLTPWSILKLCEVAGPVVPAGVLNVVCGAGPQVGRAIVMNPRIAKVAFAGSAEVGREIMGSAARRLVPVTAEVGGKPPDIFFSDIMAEDDELLEKAIEELVLFAFDKGESCVTPSRALIQEDIYGAFLGRALARVADIRQGDPLDRMTQLGAQVSARQLERIEHHVAVGRAEGARILVGGERVRLDERLAGGWYHEPTVLEGHNGMRVFQEEIFGPVLAVTPFRDEAHAVALADDSPFGLGAGVWTRDGARASRTGRTGPVWTNCAHLYPASGAAGDGSMSPRAALARYTQTRCVLVSHDLRPPGFF